MNGELAGSHVGGYTTFTLDITDFLREENELRVKVTDCSDASYHSRGKQMQKRGGIWYTPQSGIWQTVWCEQVPLRYISSLRITPLFDESALEVIAISDADDECTVCALGASANGRTNKPIRLELSGFTPWSPDEPTLYDLEITTPFERVTSYFAMRKVEIKVDSDGFPRIFLNGKPCFNNGVLDQGYWKSGMLTPPSDEAMINDISLMKRCGFNMLRKHIKIEPMRWYYHCDRLGMLVWQDMINGGGHYSPFTVKLPVVLDFALRDDRYALFSRTDSEGRAQYYRELREMIAQLYNCPCIVTWVPFNEGWGQFDALRAVEIVRSLDATRLIDHASGWHDQRGGDFRSLHVYFRRYRHKPDRFGRAVALSEFGGYAMRVEGHTFSQTDFGYSKYKTKKELTDGFLALYKREIIPAKAQGLAASVYTQLSDVEDELNGFVTYDREVVKIDPDEIRPTVSTLND